MIFRMPINAGRCLNGLSAPLSESGVKFPLIATASSIDLISCDLQGRLMSGGDVMDSDSSIHEDSPDSANSTMEYSEELADRLISRLKPEDNASILKMIANKAYFSGGLGTWYRRVHS